MNNWFEIPKDTRKSIFNEVSISEGLPVGAIEKDWWVTVALKVIFSLPYADHLAFKGGTSLSKGWNLIQRFSEDIDLALDRSFLGFGGDLSKTQVKKLRKASCGFLSNDFAQSIEKRLGDLEVPNVKLTIQEFRDSDKDPLIIELNYKSLTDDAPYLQPRVLIEVGSRSLMEPSEKREIQSMVGAHFSKEDFSDLPFKVSTVEPGRTMLEKAFLLHEEFQKPSEQIRVERLSRHLYDLDKLMETDHCSSALVDTKLYRSIVEHRKLFNPIRGIDYDAHHPSRIDFIPPESVRDDWERDYERMQESMIYGESKSFEEIINNLTHLRDKFREIKLL